MQAIQYLPSPNNVVRKRPLQYISTFVTEEEAPLSTTTSFNTYDEEHCHYFIKYKVYLKTLIDVLPRTVILVGG